MLLSKKKKKKQGSSLSRGRNEGAGVQEDKEMMKIYMYEC